jgi:hypothetical protein
MLFGLSGSQVAVLIPLVTLPFYFFQSARAARTPVHAA